MLHALAWKTHTAHSETSLSNELKLTLCMHCRLFSGGYVGGVPPVPIPNTEVKPSRADGTSRETARESRSLPDSF